MIPIFLALAIAAPTTPAPQPAAQAAPPRPAAVDIGPALKKLGFSDAGVALVRQTRATPDAPLQAVAVQQRALAQRMQAALAAPRFDAAGFAAMLDQRSALESQARAYLLTKQKGLLQRLSGKDQLLFARMLVAPAITPRAARAPASPPPAGAVPPAAPPR